MINDMYAWRKVYNGPHVERFAHKLLNDINVDPEKGIYGKRLKKFRIDPQTGLYLYDIYIKVEQKLSTSPLDIIATSRYNEDIINNNNK